MTEGHDPIAVLMYEHEFIKKVAGALGHLAPTADEVKITSGKRTRERSFFRLA